MSTKPVTAPGRNPERDTNFTHVLYLLHALAPFTAWLLAVIAIILGVVRRDEVRGTFIESHISWLSRTFWWGLLWIVICAVLTAVLFFSIIGLPIAWLPFTVLFIWYLYRVIRGWMRLSDGRPVE